MAAVEWLVTGATDSTIRDALAHRFPGIDAAATMRAAVDHLKAIATPDIDAVRGWALAACREIYRRQMEAGESADALRTVREIVALAESAD